MPDEAFEELWRQKGGPEIVALHSIFGGANLPVPVIREITGLTLEQLRVVCEAARRVGLVDPTEEGISFLVIPPDSGQRARLDWCMEPHVDELPSVEARLRSKLLLRFLAAPPGSPA